MFHRLKLYTIHMKKDESGQPEDIQFVRDGFNFWAFFLNVFWALYNRCWVLAALSLGIILGTEWLVGQNWLHETSVAVIQLGLLAIVGFVANDERRRALEKRGYTKEDVVAEENLTRAKLRFYDRQGRSAYIWQS